ncbi:hypothetical protein Tco_0439517 [Tanacetum coccineum]
MDNVNFPPPPPMVGTPEKRNMNKFCNYHQDQGHNTNDCYHLKKQIEEAVASGKLAHLVKDIRQGGQKVVVEAMIEGFRVRRIHVDSGSSSEVMYERCFRNLSYQMRSRLRESRIPLVGSQENPSPYNALLGRTGMRSLGVVASSIYLMMKFPTLNGISTISTTRETLRVCRQNEEAQDLSRHARVTNPSPMQMGSEVINSKVQLAPRETHSRRPRKEPMQLDDMEERRQLDEGRKPPKSGVEERIVVNDNYPEQLVTIGGSLFVKCRHALIHTLRKNVDIFAWAPSDMTGIPWAITEHSLDTYSHIEPKAQKKRSLTPDRRKVVTDEVNEWLKAGIVRRVRYPTWVANPVLVKKVDGSWRMCIDFKDLNKACPNDLYPFAGDRLED